MGGTPFVRLACQHPVLSDLIASSAQILCGMDVIHCKPLCEDITCDLAGDKSCIPRDRRASPSVVSLGVVEGRGSLAQRPGIAECPRCGVQAAASVNTSLEDARRFRAWRA